MNAARYAVVVVNWNGGADTVACLASILDGANGGQLIVVDNGSTDGSLARIGAALAERGLAAPRGTAQRLPVLAAPARAVLVEAGENLGFAAGCNLGLRVAEASGTEAVVFLNNDTVVEADALDRIVRRLLDDPGVFATLPMLTVHGTDRIWNCGGEAYAIGLRRYHLAGAPRSDGARRGEFRCSFFTGCCFAVRTAEFVRRGGFSERFFFGEEDFELALWMRERRLAAVCMTSAVVQHKVSASFNEAAGPRQQAKTFVYYLNRFIHMRLRLGMPRWALWVAAYLPYVAWLLWRARIVPPAGLPGFLRRLVARSAVMEGVGRAEFEAVISGRM